MLSVDNNTVFLSIYLIKSIKKRERKVIRSFFICEWKKEAFVRKKLSLRKAFSSSPSTLDNNAPHHRMWNDKIPFHSLSSTKILQFMQDLAIEKRKQWIPTASFWWENAVSVTSEKKGISFLSSRKEKGGGVNLIKRTFGVGRIRFLERSEVSLINGMT